MKEQGGGCIINTSSMVSISGQPAGVGYPASKFAVNGLTISLARELGKVLDIPVEERLLKRIRETAPQKNLTPRKRRQNLNGAFSVEKRRRVFLKSRSVLLTDDIYKTGSTVDEAAKTLKKAGAEKVFYLAISIGQGN